MTVAAMLKHKGHEVVSVEPSATVAEIASLLSARHIGAVVVHTSSDLLLGVVSERDIVHALANHGAGALQMTAGQIMTRAPQTATPQTTIIEAMEMMTEKRFRHMPVLEDGLLVGIVSIGDVVKHRLQELELEANVLRDAYMSAH